MDADQKISPFQLVCLLLCGRMFTVLIWKPEQAEAGSMILAVLLSPVVQFALVTAALWLIERLKKSSAGTGVRKLLHRLIHVSLQLAGLIFFVCTALWSAVSCGSFISSSFYGGRFRLFFVAIILAAGVFAVFQGLEGIARTAPIVLLMTVGGLVLLGAGAVGSMQLRYLPPLTVSAQGTAGLALQSGMMNFELVLLIFLQPYATKPLRKRAIAVWLALTAALSIAVMAAVMLCLGYYAQGVQYPILAVARCARLVMLERLDPVLMGIWVLLGLIKTSVLLFMSAQLWRQLFIKSAWAWKTKGVAAAALLLSVMTLSGCSSIGDDIGAKTIVTMMEVEQGNLCTVRVEYRVVGNGTAVGDGDVEYGVYTAEGDDLAAALEAVRRKESVKLFTESCRVVVIQGEETAPGVLEELGKYSGIRPLTAVFVSDGMLLTQDKDKAVSIGRSLEKLFLKNGGLLPDKYTLKDSVASLRDPRLELQLPMVTSNDRGDGVYFDNFIKLKKDSFVL